MENKIYHYFYKITNKINGNFYFGIHSTKNLNDGYMGSGTILHRAYKKYGIDSFEKEIIAFFDNREDASKYEAEIVNNSFIENSSCYNIRLGGDDVTTIGTVTAKDCDGNILQIPQKEFDSNPDKYVGVTCGTLSAKNIETGEINRITVDEYRNNKHKFKSFISDKTCVIDANTNEYIWVSIDEYYNSEKYKHSHSNKVLVKNKNNKCFIVDKTDDRIKTGELTLFWKNRQHTKETKEKLKEAYRKTNHQQGEKNSQFGTCWITKDGINKKINKSEISLYESHGWCKGRVMMKK